MEDLESIQAKRLADYRRSLPRSFWPSLPELAEAITAHPLASFKDGRMLSVRGELLFVPIRIYEELPLQYGGGQRLVDLAACLLFSRHHNGFVRETCARRLIHWRDPIVLPYLMFLAGEYVREIGATILEGYSPARIGSHADVVVENSRMLEVEVSRAISYWNAYYRHGPLGVALGAYEPFLFLAACCKAANLKPPLSVPRRYRQLFLRKVEGSALPGW